MQRWFPNIPVWVWCLIFGVTIFTINALSARSYAETEFWFSSIKVSAIIAFIILGGAAMFGFIDLKGDEPAPLLSNFVNHGGLFPNGLAAILLTMVTVNYSSKVQSLSESQQVKAKIQQKLYLVLLEILYGAQCFSSS